MDRALAHVPYTPPSPRRPPVAPPSGASRIAGSLLLVFLSFFAHAAVPRQDTSLIDATSDESLEAFVDDLMAQQFEEYLLAGASVAVVRGEELVVSKGYGFADLAATVPVDPTRTVFGTASVAKPFVWTAVMQLVERGELDLDEDVNAYLTTLRIPDRFGEPVRLWHLMSHTAGFEDKPVAGLLSRTGGPGLEASLARYLPAREWPPGQSMAYSNYGAALAGYIVAEVTGDPWEEYLETSILAPLKMTRSSGHQPIPAHLAENLTTAYHEGPDGLVETGHEYVPLSPAGGMVTTTEDMANFMIAHLRNGAFGEARILQEATVREMHSRLFTHDERLPGNAHGFWEGMHEGQRFLYHGGDTSSYTLLVLVPEHELGFYLAYNSPDGALARDAFTDAFFDHLFPAAPTQGIEEAVTTAGWFEPWAGSYGVNRISTTTLTKLIALGGTLSVSSEEGYLVTEMPVVGRQRWSEAAPRFFTEVGGSERLVVQEDDQGRIEQMFFSELPMLAFTPIAWHDRAELHAALLGISLLALLSALVAWPLFGRRDRAANGTKRALWARVARRLPALTSVLYVLFFVTLGLFLLDPLEVEFGMPPILAASLTLGLVAATSTLASVVVAFFAWRRRSWSLLERAHYSLIALVCISLAWQLHNWNLLGFRV